MAAIWSSTSEKKEQVEVFPVNKKNVGWIGGATNRLSGMRAAMLFAMAHAFAVNAHAAAAGTLPWERPMTAIATSLTGPVAYAIGLIGIAIAGGAMLWGGELTEFGRRACMIGLVVSVLVFAAPMLSSAFGVTAAVV
jgi:type IV secretion system protein VirB2